MNNIVNYIVPTSSSQNQFVHKEWSSIEENNNTKNHINVAVCDTEQPPPAFSRPSQPDQNYQQVQSTNFFENQFYIEPSNYTQQQQQQHVAHIQQQQSNNNFHFHNSGYEPQNNTSPRDPSPIMYSHQPPQTGHNSDTSSGSSSIDSRLIDSQQQHQHQHHRSQNMPINSNNNSVYSEDSDITSTVGNNSSLISQTEILDLDSHKVHQVLFQGNTSNDGVPDSKNGWGHFMARANFPNGGEYNQSFIANNTYAKSATTTVPVPNISPTSSSSAKPTKKSITKWRSNEPRRPKSYLCKACDKWFTSSGHLKRHYNTTLHKNAVTNSNEPDPATLPVSAHYHPERAAQLLQQQQQQQQSQPAEQTITATNQVPNVKCLEGENVYEQSKAPVQLSTLRPMIPIEPSSVYGYQQQQQPQPSQTHSQQTQGQDMSTHNHHHQQQLPQSHAHDQQSIVEILNAQNDAQHFQNLASNSLNFPSNYPNELAPHVMQTSTTTNNSSNSIMSNNIHTTVATNNIQVPTSGEYILTAAPSSLQINAHFLVPQQHQQQTLPSFEHLQSHRYGYLDFSNVKVEPIDANDNSTSMTSLENMGGQDSVTNPQFDLEQQPELGPKTYIVSSDFTANKENIQLLIKAASDNELNADNYSLCFFENRPAQQLLINVPDSSSSASTSIMHSPPTSTITSPNSSQAKLMDPIKRRKSNAKTVVKQEINDDNEGLISSTGSPTDTPLVSPSLESGNIEPDKPYCKLCNKVFNKVCYYTQHNRSFHDGNKPYKCEKCGKKFKKEDLFNIHVTKHEGNKPHKCKLCPKQFNHKTDLSRHYYLHSGQKPYACDRCGKGFIRRDHMLKHRETHTRKNQVIRCQQNLDLKKSNQITQNS